MIGKLFENDLVVVRDFILGTFLAGLNFSSEVR